MARDTNDRQRPVRGVVSSTEEQGTAQNPFQNRVLAPELDPEQATWRGMSRGIPGRADDDQVVSQHKNAPTPGTPFRGFAPSSDQMRKDAEHGREEGKRVVVIVGGVLFALISSVSVGGALLLIGMLVATGNVPGLADADADKVNHLTDDNVADVTDPVRKSHGGGGGGGGKAAEDDGPTEVDPLSLPGTIIVHLPETLDVFNTVEVYCPSGWRGRGKLRGRKATVNRVPVERGCKMSLQGSRAVLIFVRAHGTYTCLGFDPPDCRIR